MYSTGRGIFLQRDPIGYVAGLNLYCAYFVPLVVDPYGLDDEAFRESIYTWLELTFIERAVTFVSPISWAALINDYFSAPQRPVETNERPYESPGINTGPEGEDPADVDMDTNPFLSQDAVSDLTFDISQLIALIDGRYNSVDIHFAPFGGGLTTVTCCNENGREWEYKYYKLCVGTTSGIAVGTGLVTGIDGERCRVDTYEGYFLETNIGPAGVDVSLTEAHPFGIPVPLPGTPSGTNEAGISVGLIAGTSICYYKRRGEGRDIGECCYTGE